MFAVFKRGTNSAKHTDGDHRNVKLKTAGIQPSHICAMIKKRWYGIRCNFERNFYVNWHTGTLFQWAVFNLLSNVHSRNMSLIRMKVNSTSTAVWMIGDISFYRWSSYIKSDREIARMNALN